MKTLILGCSFLRKLADQQGNWQLDQQRYTVAATSGSGNQAISSRLIFECAQQPFSEVIIIWTGLNRLDVAIPTVLHETQPKKTENNYAYSFNHPMRNVTWYHSGGIAGSWTWDDSCPKFVKDWLKVQHLYGDSPYLQDLSLLSMIHAQSFLESRNIKYRMCFAYNIFHHHDRHEHCFGQLEQDFTTYAHLINWDRIDTRHGLFEWAHQDPARLEADRFHVTRDAVREWFNLVFSIDLAEKSY